MFKIVLELFEIVCKCFGIRCKCFVIVWNCVGYLWNVVVAVLGVGRRLRRVKQLKIVIRCHPRMTTDDNFKLFGDVLVGG